MLELLIGGFGLFGFVVAISLVVLAVLWFVLPFAVFGTKQRLDRLISSTKAVGEALEGIHCELRELRGELTQSRRESPAS